MKLNKIILVLTLVIIAGGLLYYVGSNNSSSSPSLPGGSEKTSTEKPVAVQAGWLDTELTDARTGKKFRISDFKGKPVLLESFAVWCPTCLKQQKEIEKLADEKGDEIIHISLDTDPNEDIDKVIDHVKRNGFDWFYAISPIEMTRELTKVFGLTFVNAPSAPVVLICADQSYRFLQRGVKKSDKLLDEIERGCAT